MKLEDFADLPRIDKRKDDERLKIHEKAIAELPSIKGGYDYFDIYVAGINSSGMVVLSTEVNPIDPSLIECAIAVEPSQIRSYKTSK
jgi:hypothetical protein